MAPVVLSCYRATEKGEAILAELDDRLSDEPANGYRGMTTPDRDGMVSIRFDADVDQDLAERRVRAVLGETHAAWTEHVTLGEAGS